jgi:serine O-acetyltransferase
MGGSDGIGLLELLREDRLTHGSLAWARPGFHALAVHRLTTWHRAYRGPAPLRKAAGAGINVLSFFVRSVYGIEIALDVEVGRRLHIAHQSGMMLGPERFGDDCIVRHNVTIAAASPDGARPVIEDGVNIGSGAVILGPVTIGAGTRIGPNAVVTRSVPPNSLVVAPPARVIPAPAAPAGDAGQEDGTAEPAREEQP